MMGELPGQLLIQVILIAVNAFFAATEIAVLALNTAKLKKQQEEGDRVAGRLLKLAEEPNGFLSTIQVGITLAGFMGSAFAAENFSDMLTSLLYDDLGIQAMPRATLETISVIVITLVLSYFTLILGELVPKRVAMQKPYAVARIASGPVSVIAAVMKPVIAFLALSTNISLRLLGTKPGEGEEKVTEEEIRLMIDLGEENGAIDEDEKEWLQNVFDFGDMTVDMVMTREYEVESVSVSDSEDTILTKIRRTGLSRFPVYNEEQTDIVGILYAREYLLNLSGAAAKEDLTKLLHPAYFVPESLHADQLFENMQKKKLHMAVVVNEYGDISGIITMEDLLEQIVGSIYDEFDGEEEPEAEQLEENLWRFPGETPVEEAAELIGIRIPESDAYDTIGGMLLSCLEFIPEDGTTVDVEFGGLELHAERISGRRIESVLLKVQK